MHRQPPHLVTDFPAEALAVCRQSKALSVECFMRHMNLAACTIPLLERIGRLQRLAKLHGQMQSRLQWQHAAAQVRIAWLGCLVDCED